MTKREILEEMAQDQETEFLLADGLDEAIIGVDDQSGRVVYCINTIYRVLMAQGLTWEEAVEHFDFNIGGAFVGEKTPIFVTPL